MLRKMPADDMSVGFISQSLRYQPCFFQLRATAEGGKGKQRRECDEVGGSREWRGVEERGGECTASIRVATGWEGEVND